ncbi:ferredoxin reductase [Aquipuribacter nitratireducens]|uniref:Ferredoxin reductase n=1 Tax=Aquipuribacter nitratireducens TaxID=650104 RepID=A0ABW0GTD7_9MICO
MALLRTAPMPPPTPRRGPRLDALGTAARRVAAMALTPLVPADYLDLVAPLRKGADLRAKVVRLERETRDATTVVLRPGGDWQGHVPGQYVRLGIDVDGVRRWRAYSLTSVPAAPDGLISVTVKAIPDGVVSRHVRDRLRPGTIVQLDQATGDFVLGAHRGPTLFLTAGSGITPVMGMLRSRLDALDDVVVVHSAPTRDDVVFGPQLRAWHAEGRLRLVERRTASAGILHPSALDDVVPDWRDRHTWACGPTALLDDAETHWADAGLADRLHTERFRATVVATGEGGTVTFARSGTDVEADGATPLLDAGEGAGVLMPSGCRMGICFGCVAGLRSGAVRDLRSGELTTAVPEDGVRIQTCVSAAAGPCEIDL